jgi:hypothetical protein
MTEAERMLLQHLVNMLAIIAADREALKIERGSQADKEIVAARKAVIEMRQKHGEYDDAERAI